MSGCHVTYSDCHVICHVIWIPKGANKTNKTVHSLTKWSFVNNVFGFLDVGFGPSYFESIIKEEALVS